MEIGTKDRNADCGQGSGVSSQAKLVHSINRKRPTEIGTKDRNADCPWLSIFHRSQYCLIYPTDRFFLFLTIEHTIV